MLLQEKLLHLRSNIVATDGVTPSLPGAPARRPDLDLVLGGAARQTPVGTCYAVESQFPQAHRHGRIALGAGRNTSARALALLVRAMTVPDSGLERAIFLDTETTGLSGGAGTYVFLVGVGHFQGESFVVRQFFMRDYGEEAALLAAVREAVAGSELVITFNGKCFDLPLLQARYVQARQESPLDRLPHLDLLHPSRRLWRHRLESCRLVCLEEHLGHHRQQDVPSWMIPSLYFNFVRRGEAGPMAEVFEHNRHDVLSLVALLGQLGELLDRPLADGRSAEELLQLGRMYEDGGQADDAAVAYAGAWELAAAQPVGEAAALRLAALHKRAGRTELAAPIWLLLASGSSSSSVLACVELAKHFEHRARDRVIALEHTLRALDRLDVLDLLRPNDPSVSQERKALEHRLARLSRSRVP